MTVMGGQTYSDAFIGGILRQVTTIAMVGASANTVRPSYFAMKYLLGRGYRVIPVNPGKPGDTILGQTVHGALSDIAEPIDMVDIFRPSEAVAEIVEEALSLSPLPKVIWMQIGVRDETAAARAEAAGMKVVMNRCPKIEYGRLSGEIGWAGVNRNTLSSRKPARAGSGRQRLDLAPTQSRPRR